MAINLNVDNVLQSESLLSIAWVITQVLYTTMNFLYE